MNFDFWVTQDLLSSIKYVARCIWVKQIITYKISNS